MKIPLRDYSLTLSSSLLVSGFSFVLYKLVLVYFGEEELELFSVLKRYQSILVPILLFGFGVTLPRCIAKSQADKGIIYLSLTVCLTLTIILLLFSGIYDANLFFACLISLPALMSGYFFSVSRGLSDFRRAASVSVGFMIMAPIVGFIFTNNLIEFIYGYAFITILLSIVLFISYKKDFKFIEDKCVEKISKRKFMSMSILRVPGDFCNQALLLLPIQLLIINQDYKMAAYFSLAISVVVAFGIPLKPISTILLVKISSIENRLLDNIRSLTVFFFMSIVVSTVYFFATSLINLFYFDNKLFLDVLIQLSPLVFFSSFYILSRSYVDALYDFPVLTVLNLMALCSLVTILLVFEISVANSISLSYGLLALTTVILILKRKNV